MERIDKNDYLRALEILKQYRDITPASKQLAKETGLTLEDAKKIIAEVKNQYKL